jgi:hypothetical protein
MIRFHIYKTVRNLLGLISALSKVVRYKISIQRSEVFLYTDTKHAEEEIRKTIPFTIASKNIQE